MTVVAEELNNLRFKTLESELDRQGNRLTNLESNITEVVKISTLMEIQIEMNKNQDKLLEQQSETLGKINKNLTSLNNVTVNLDRRIGDLEQEVKTDNEKNKIDMRDLVKKVFTGLAIGALAFIAGMYGIPFLP